MATESTSVERARTLTLADSSIIPEPKMTTLEEMAKDEIQIAVSDESLEFTSKRAESALTWLLCLFIKIHIGEIGADDFTVGEIEQNSLSEEQQIWLNEYQSSIQALIGDGFVRHAKPSRTNRSYGGS